MSVSNASIIERNYAYDAMRFFGVLVIMIAHSNPPKWLFQLRNFGTPLLIIASALTYSYIYENKKFELKKFYRKRFVRLTIPAWIFLTFFFVSYYLISIITDSSYQFDKMTIISSYLFGYGIGYVWIFKGEHSPFLNTLETFFRDIAVQHGIESFIVDRAAQSQHGIAVFLQPPGPGALEPHMTDVLVG